MEEIYFHLEEIDLQMVYSWKLLFKIYKVWLHLYNQDSLKIKVWWTLFSVSSNVFYSNSYQINVQCCEINVNFSTSAVNFPNSIKNECFQNFEYIFPMAFMFVQSHVFGTSLSRSSIFIKYNNNCSKNFLFKVVLKPILHHFDD